MKVIKIESPDPVKVNIISTTVEVDMSETTTVYSPGGSNQLTFEALRRANFLRIPEFKNCHGEPAHSEPDGSDWNPAQWLQAVVGELGEYADKRKKFERGDITEDEFYLEARKELADVVTYLDILAFQLGINLGEAVVDKFNEVSKRVGASIFLKEHD